MAVPTPTQANITGAMNSFLLSILPATASDGTPVSIIVGQQNRIPEPAGSAYVIMTPRSTQRLETNVDIGVVDIKFTAAIADDVMTVSAMAPNSPNSLQIGSVIFGPGVQPGTKISGPGSGAGGVGTYQVSISQTVPSATLSAGFRLIQQALKCTIQLDFHSASSTDSADMANTVSTLMRDAYAVQQFANQSPNFDVVPLYADDSRQVPWLNDQQQVEWKWTVEAHLQANISVTVPMQFADAISLGLVSVDEAFPQ